MTQPTPDIRVIELPKSDVDPQLVHETALLIGEEFDVQTPTPRAVKHQMRRSDESMTAVALDRGKVIATGALSSPEDPFYAGRRHLLDMVVAEDYRGDGIGRRVVNFLETQARETYDQQLYVVSLMSARGFYYNLGFRTYRDTLLVKDL